MSLQNILALNRSHLYCRDLNVSATLLARNIEVDVLNVADIEAASIRTPSITTNEIYSFDGGDKLMDLSETVQPGIIVEKSILPPIDNGANLGQDGLKFGELHVSQIYGPNASINIVNSLSGASNLLPLQLQNGFLVVGSNQSTFNKYIEHVSSAPIQVGGPFGNIDIVNYKATRIGNIVHLGLSFIRQQATSSPNSIEISGFDATFLANFVPSVDAVYFPIWVQTSNNTAQECLGQMSTTGVLTIALSYDTTGAVNDTMTFTLALGTFVGLAASNGSYATVTYYLN